MNVATFRAQIVWRIALLVKGGIVNTVSTEVRNGTTRAAIGRVTVEGYVISTQIALFRPIYDSVMKAFIKRGIVTVKGDRLLTTVLP